MTHYLLHSVLVVYYIFFFIYATFIFVPPPCMNKVHDNFMDSLMAGPGKYLTVWNLMLQAVYFSIALIFDLIGSNECAPSKIPAIRRIRDYVFCSLAFPTTLFVVVLFWSLVAIDRDLVLPKAIAEYFPSWYNHMLHTNVIVLIVLEGLTTFHQYPSVKNGLSGLTVIIASYVIWTLIIYFYGGLWVYPVLKILSWPWRIVFFFNSFVGGYACYFVGQYLNNTVWAEHKSQLEKQK